MKNQKDKLEEQAAEQEIKILLFDDVSDKQSKNLN